MPAYCCITVAVTTSFVTIINLKLIVQGPKRPYKHKDPTNHDFWYPPCIGPWNQNIRSLCLCGLLGPDYRRAEREERLLLRREVGPSSSPCTGNAPKWKLGINRSVVMFLVWDCHCEAANPDWYMLQVIQSLAFDIYACS